MIEDRQKIWKDYIAQGGMYHRNVERMFLDYSRYYEAEAIQRGLVSIHEDIAKFRILDFGCGVGDYGIFLLNAGAKQIDFWDFPRSTNLVTYRLEQDGLKNGRALNADKDKLVWKYDMIIFGEVLEHLESPYATLLMAVTSPAKSIFTSSYPYRSEDPTDRYWSNGDHSEQARLEIPQCKKLLEDNFSFIKFGGELRLWIRK